MIFLGGDKSGRLCRVNAEISEDDKGRALGVALSLGFALCPFGVCSLFIRGLLFVFLGCALLGFVVSL